MKGTGRRPTLRRKMGTRTTCRVDGTADRCPPGREEDISLEICPERADVLVHLHEQFIAVQPCLKQTTSFLFSLPPAKVPTLAVSFERPPRN